MKKTFFSRWSKQLLAIICIYLAATASSFAGDAKGYFDYYANLEAYPSGAGKVYAEVYGSDITTTNELDEPLSDMSTPANSIEVMYIAKDNDQQSFFAYAEPEEGWTFLGFSAATRDADDNFVFNDDIVANYSGAMLSISPNINAEDLNSAQMLFPLAADTAYYALFTRVAPTVAEGQATLGTVTSSKKCNDIGDAITLTAEATDTEHTRFDYWIDKNTGEKLTANPLSITVTEADTYEAHFYSDEAIYINFPEEGGYKIFYCDSAVSVPSNVEIKTFNYTAGEYGDSVRYSEESKKFYQSPSSIGYSNYAHQPVIMYGTGEATFVKNTDGDNPYPNSYFRWSGEDGVKVSDLSVLNHYYTVNLESQQFELLDDEATIPANTIYWALPNERYEVYGVNQAPNIIYWYEPTVDGINQIAYGSNKNDANKNMSIKKSNGIYNLQGQKVNKMIGNGIYIINGKKVINLNKQ